MFEKMSIEALQHYWWIIVSLLGSALVFLMFVQGGQTLIYRIGKTAMQRTMLVNTIGRKWDLAFTTLVTFGGALFASFPMFYATSFGGAYWLWMILLFTFIVQAVSYEFRSKEKNLLGQRVYDIFLLINGIIGPLFVGIVVSTFFTGAEFSINHMRLTSSDEYTITQWENSKHGFEALLDLQNLLLGFTVFFIARILALLYFINSIDDAEIHKRSIRSLIINTILLLPFLLGFLYELYKLEGYFIPTNISEYINLEEHKYFHNLLQIPIASVMFFGGIVAILSGIIYTIIKKVRWGIWPTGIGVVMVVFSLFLIAGFNNSSYYPSVYDPQNSLTIHNSSSSKYTLTIMSYVSLLVPFIIAYIVYAWRSINNAPIDEKEINSTEHKY